MTSVRDIQVLLGLMNFYRPLVTKSAHNKLPLTKLPRKAETPKSPKTTQKVNKRTYKLGWTCEADLALWRLRKAFTLAPIVHYFDPADLIFLQTNASVFAITGIR
jgi:hypothetical protein